MMNPSPTIIRGLISVAIFLWLVAIYFRTKSLLHMLQLGGYQSKGYLIWALKHLNKLFTAYEFISCLFLMSFAGIGYYYAHPLGLYLFLLFWFAGQVYLTFGQHKIPAKKPLVFTPRASRLMMFFCFVLGCQLLGILWLFFRIHPFVLYPLEKEIQIGMQTFVALISLTLITPLNILIANLLATPLEVTINLGYFIVAQRKVSQYSELKVIAITGSYGKTSTKYILNGLLAPYYSTLMTPESYNTPMGISKVIRGELTDKHEYFIVEMGARKRGDIKQLCRLVSPKIGVITSIGPQHLETFGTLDNILNTKFELVAGLGPDGLAVFNFDDPDCRKLAAKTAIPYRSYGIDSTEELNLRANKIQTNKQGICFTLQTAQGENIRLSTCLLGAHNVYNILAAATIALECGLSLSHIARALKQIKPVPHRLQLIHGRGGITIIDDAYNSNPKGAHEALQVLKNMRGGRKILITPGMVELGAIEQEQNTLFGKNAAGACDAVILVGKKRTRPIAQGLSEAGFPNQKLTVVASLAEATNVLHKIAKPGDVVLFENDLPDNYNE
jgi:UDP-N-acetylmuramoyl-tripeptide--D-alanyl-D-alanine ligase